MKKLTQKNFKGQPPHVRSAMVVSSGMAYGLEVTAEVVRNKGVEWALKNQIVSVLSGVYDITDWKNSAIDREVQP